MDFDIELLLLYGYISSYKFPHNFSYSFSYI